MSQTRDAVVQYPGGIRVRYRWGGSGQAADVFALSEAGPLQDLGPMVSPEPDRLCRAELAVEAPAGRWNARLASAIYDEPSGLYWDTVGLLVVTFGFHTWAFEARTGELRWHHRSATPVLAVLGSSRLPHVIVQAEIETFAIEADGTVAWRVAHSDVVAEADLLGGRLVLASYGGTLASLDPATGRSVA
jgi:hypothetical protein